MRNERVAQKVRSKSVSSVMFMLCVCCGVGCCAVSLTASFFFLSLSLNCATMSLRSSLASDFDFLAGCSVKNKQ